MIVSTVTIHWIEYQKLLGLSTCSNSLGSSKPKYYRHLFIPNKLEVPVLKIHVNKARMTGTDSYPLYLSIHMPFNLGGPVIMPHRVLTECLTKVNGVICQWLSVMFELFFSSSNF